MNAAIASITIDDISEIGTELTEDELANVAGGRWCIYVACSCAAGGGYDYD